MKNDVYNPSAFRFRVEYAARCYMRGSTGSRKFDTCFEMWDGAAVTAALVARALKNPRLRSAIAKDWPGSEISPEGLPCSMMKTYQKFSGYNLDFVALKLRETQQEWTPEPIQSPPPARPELPDMTQLSLGLAF